MTIDDDYDFSCKPSAENKFSAEAQPKSTERSDITISFFTLELPDGMQFSFTERSDVLPEVTIKHLQTVSEREKNGVWRENQHRQISVR